MGTTYSEARVEEHYRSLLAVRYTWMMGGAESCLTSARELLQSVGALMPGEGTVLDLGCGPGFHARALAETGKRVIAVDNSEALLRELGEVCAGLDVVPVCAELSDVQRFASLGPFTTILCVGDTLTHLRSLYVVDELIDDLSPLLRPRGQLILEFREQPRELSGQDAVLTLRAERDRIMQCVLHFEPECVWVTDVVHEWTDGKWRVIKSSYPKLRLSGARILVRATAAGLQVRSDTLRAGRRVLVLER
jgi:2-polyprenyl-3-methyl-5-hydroxy-6-metoxy-1,4-benzoquinol methylase